MSEGRWLSLGRASKKLDSHVWETNGAQEHCGMSRLSIGALGTRMRPVSKIGNSWRKIRGDSQNADAEVV